MCHSKCICDRISVSMPWLEHCWIMCITYQIGDMIHSQCVRTRVHSQTRVCLVCVFDSEFDFFWCVWCVHLIVCIFLQGSVCVWVRVFVVCTIVFLHEYVMYCHVLFTWCMILLYSQNTCSHHGAWECVYVCTWVHLKTHTHFRVHVCAYVCMCMCVHVYVTDRELAHARARALVCVRENACVCVWIRGRACEGVRLSVRLCVCLYTCVRVHVITCVLARMFARARVRVRACMRACVCVWNSHADSHICLFIT